MGSPPVIEPVAGEGYSAEELVELSSNLLAMREQINAEQAMGLVANVHARIIRIHPFEDGNGSASWRHALAGLDQVIRKLSDHLINFS